MNGKNRRRRRISRRILRVGPAAGVQLGVPIAVNADYIFAVGGVDDGIVPFVPVIDPTRQQLVVFPDAVYQVPRLPALVLNIVQNVVVVDVGVARLAHLLHIRVDDLQRIGEVFLRLFPGELVI